MKVFQELRTAIEEWEQSRDTILKIAQKLRCSVSEILGKIGQLQEARPASDLNSIDEQIGKLMDSLDNAMGRAEDTQSQVESAQSELEYVDASDAACAIEDVSSDLDMLRKDIRKELDGDKE